MGVGGLFFTGTDTGVGKTRVAAAVARHLAGQGVRVGVYKPAASGCRRAGGTLISDDALALWESAGRPGALEAVCPQCFEAPLAPHLAARAEGRRVDPRQLREGLDAWTAGSDLVLVEGAGGLLSPISDEDYVADLAAEFGFPLVIVARNALGTINQTLQTLLTAAAWGDGLEVAGIVLNQTSPPGDDPSQASNAQELRQRAGALLLAQLGWQAEQFEPPVDWAALAQSSRR